MKENIMDDGKLDEAQDEAKEGEVQNDENLDDDALKDEAQKGIKEATKKIVDEVKAKKRKTKKFWIIVGIVSGLAIIIIAGLILTTVFQLDAKIWPSTLSGYIEDVTGQPLSDVSICVQGKCVNTDNSGLFAIENLVYGEYKVAITKDGFNVVDKMVLLNRGEVENLNIQLDQIKAGNIIVPIKFEYSTGHQNYDSDFLLDIDFEIPDFVGQAAYSGQANNGGIGDSANQPTSCTDQNTSADVVCKVTFYNIPLGKHKLLLTSMYFVDQSIDIEVKQGTTTIAEMVLSPAINISGVVNDGFFGGTLEKAKVKITAPVQVETETDATGKYSILDIKIPQSTYPKTKVVYEVSKVGYNTVNSECEFDVDYNYSSYDSLIPQGKVVTVSNKLGNKNLISTSIDGSNEFSISDNKGDNYNAVLLKDGKTVRFLSTRDGIKSKYGSNVPLVYQIDIDGKNLKKISKTNYIDNDGIGNFNLASGKRAFTVYEYNGNSSFYTLKAGNLEGTELKVVESGKTDGYFGNIVIADSGEYLLYSWKDNLDQTLSGVYRYDFNADKVDFLYNVKESNYTDVKTISQDLNQAIVQISTGWEDEGDLWLLNISGKKLTRITNSSTGELKPTFFNGDKSILYQSRRDDLLSVYIWDLGKGKETKISNVSGTDQEFYANMCADLVANTKYEPTMQLINKALAQENAMCPGPYYKYYD